MVFPSLYLYVFIPNFPFEKYQLLPKNEIFIFTIALKLVGSHLLHNFPTDGYKLETGRKSEWLGDSQGYRRNYDDTDSDDYENYEDDDGDDDGEDIVNSCS